MAEKELKQPLRHVILRPSIKAFSPPEGEENLLSYRQFMELSEEEKITYLDSLSFKELFRFVNKAIPLKKTQIKFL